MWEAEGSAEGGALDAGPGTEPGWVPRRCRLCAWLVGQLGQSSLPQCVWLPPAPAAARRHTRHALGAREAPLQQRRHVAHCTQQPQPTLRLTKLSLPCSEGWYSWTWCMACVWYNRGGQGGQVRREARRCGLPFHKARCLCRQRQRQG